MVPKRPKRAKAASKALFNAQAFLDSAGVARKVAEFKKKETIFSQGDPCRSVFYIQKGGVRLSVVNESGKEAVVAVLGPGDFVGEGCLAGQPIRIGTATAVAPTTALVIEKSEMVRVLHCEHEFSDRFITFMLARNIRIEEDLIDQLLIPARSAWRARCCFWRAMARKTNRNGFFPKSRKKRSQKWSAPPAPA